MGSHKLSKGEIQYITIGVKNNFREDGRQRMDFRRSDVECDIIPHSCGSSRVILGETDVICSVKVDLGIPDQKPTEGILKFAVFFSSKIDLPDKDKLSIQIANYLQLAYSSSLVFDYKKLCIVPGKKCWILNIDVQVLSNNGNVIDAVGLAVKSALYKTRLPLIKRISDNGNNDYQIEIDYNIKMGLRFDANKMPLFVTIRKIGAHYVVDPTANEDKAGRFGLIIAVSMKKIVGVFKIGAGSTDLSHLIDNLSMALQVGVELNQQLMNFLIDDEQQIQTTANYSFF